MRITILVTFIALAAAPVAFGQNSSGGGGTEPQNKGSTGWTGGHPDIGGSTNAPQQTTGQESSDADAKAAAGQPLTATGEDLKGPPKRFAPSKTPE